MLTVARIAIARLVGRRRAVAPLFGAFALAFVLLAVLPETAYLSDAASFQSLLVSLPITDSTVQVQATGLGSDKAVSDFERDVNQRAAKDEHAFFVETSFRAETAAFTEKSHNGVVLPPRDRSVFEFSSHSNLQAQADLVTGAWTSTPLDGSVPVTLSDQAALDAHAQPGDQVCVGTEGTAQAICFTVAGIWRPRDPTSAYWAGDDMLANEAEVSRADLASLGALGRGGFDATIVLVPDLGAIGRADPAIARESLAGLGPGLSGNLPRRQVLTGLDTAVADFGDRSRVATFALDLITAQLWLIGGYCLLFLVGIRLERDRDAVGVLRTRGWPRALVALLLSVELVAVAAVAVIPGVSIGLAIAAGVIHATYPAAALPIGSSFRALAPAIVTGLLVVAVATLALAVAATRVSVVRVRAASSRPQSRWWNTRWATFAALLIAAPVLAQARALGDARLREAGTGLPYDLLLPGLGMALFAFAGISLMPAAARAFARFAGGLEARLAALQLARAAGRQQRLSLLVVSTIALAVLAATYSGTAAANAADRAAYAAGADLRVMTGRAARTDLQSLDVAGATARTEVFRDFAAVGPRALGAQALGVDPYTFAAVAWTRPGLISPDLPTMMRGLASAEKGGTLLPDQTTGLSIWIYGSNTGGSLSAAFTDADLMPVTANLGALDFGGWRQLTDTFEPSRFKPPLRLRHLTFGPVTKEGTVAISDLEAVQGVTGSTSVYGFDTQPLPDLPGWWRSGGASGSLLDSLQPDDTIAHNGQATSHLLLSPGLLSVTLTPPVYEVDPTYHQLTTLPVPVLVSTGLLAAHQVKIGDSLAVLVGNLQVNAVIVGSFSYFPTLYGDSLVFSLPLLLQVLGGEGHPRPWASELWASVAASSIQADEVRLAANPNVVEVVSRQDLSRQATGDPLDVAARTNLLLGFTATCVLAVTGFAILFAFLARSRTAEYAILEANGLSKSQVVNSLLIEQALIIAFSTVLGLIVGATLAYVLLPGLQFSTTLADNVPPTVLAVNVGLGVGGVAVTIAACLVAGVLVAQTLRRISVMPELRALG